MTLKQRSEQAWWRFVNHTTLNSYPVFAEYTNHVPIEVFKDLYIAGFIMGLSLSEPKKRRKRKST